MDPAAGSNGPGADDGENAGLVAELWSAPNRLSLRLRLYALLVAVDFASTALGFAFANLVRFGEFGHRTGISMAIMLIPVYVAVAANSRAYSMDALSSSRHSIFRACRALLISIALILFVSFSLKSTADFSRIVLAVGTAGGAVILVATRLVFSTVAARLFGASPLTVLLIRDGVDCAAIEGAHLLDARDAALRPDLDDPLMLDRLARYLRYADRVIVACEHRQRHAWAMVLKGANVHGEVLFEEIDDLGAIGTGRYGVCATLRVSAGPLGLRDRALKRLLDLALAAVAITLVGPLMAIIIAAIKLDSPGPAFFVQPRSGRGNRLFNMYKFRSMRVQSSDVNGNQSTQRADDRITRVGRFIRRTSLDELPQLLNVFRGEMSIVGPRPHALGSLAGDKLFWEVDYRYWHRHAAKPGLTGLAQIRGFRGATHHQHDLSDRLQADLEYLSDWTLMRDLSIILATFRVLVHKNAY